MSLETVAVTGGTGFLGFHLVPELLRKGYKVKLLNRRGSRHPLVARYDAGVEIVELDFSDEQALTRACIGAYAVIHAAGVVSYSEKDYSLMRQTHVKLTEDIVAAAGKAGVKRFVHVSSIVALGCGTELRDESAAFNAEHLRLAYWSTKAEAERIALAANAPGFEVVVVNPGTLLGLGEKTEHNLSFFKKLASKERPFLPEGGSDFVDAADAARGTVLALERGRAGERYILGGENLTYAQLHKKLRDALGMPARARRLPQTLLRFVGAALAMIETVTGLDLPLNSARLRRVNGVFMFHDLSKSRRELGYEPRPIDQALLHMLKKNRKQLDRV